jgi:hypothetical protein
MDQPNLNYVVRHAKIPSFLQLGESDITHAGLGIFAKYKIKANTFLGVYEGEVSRIEMYPDSKYRWALYGTNKDGKALNQKLIAFVDAYHIEKSNWCRYIMTLLNIGRIGLLIVMKNF